MASPGQPLLSEALHHLWVKFLPQLEERLSAMEIANQAFLAGDLSADQRSAAEAAAHKLAGVLGTFGLTHGTILAREAEVLYSRDPGDDPETAARLAQIAADLRDLIASRK